MDMKQVTVSSSQNDGEQTDLPPDVEPNILEVSPLVARIMSEWRHDPKALVALFHSCHENWKKYTNFQKRKKWSDRVYAVYRQATQGNNRTEIPFDEEARKKWHAWKDLWGMAKGEAQRRYITLLASIDPWLVVPKDPEAPPPGFVRTKGDEIICARSNAKRMCTQPLLEVFNPKEPPVKISAKLDEDETLLEDDNFREYMSKVLGPEGHRCQYGVHRSITLLEAKPFMEWFDLPLVEAFRPYKNQPALALIKEFLQRQYNILDYMQGQNASYFVQVKQLKLVQKVNDFYIEVSGENYIHEANCIRDNDHCNRRRQMEGGFNHTHVVPLEWPEVDYSAYSKVVELRLECNRHGLSMITGIVTDPEKRAQMYIDRLEEYYRIEAKKALARERQRFRALRRPVNMRNMKHQQADQAESALARFLIEGNTSKVLRNVEYGTDPDLEVRGGLTPLILGALANAQEFTTVLVTHGASINYENAHGMTALMWACKADNPEMVKLLLSLGADAFQESETGMTALIVATRHGRVRLVDVLCNFVRERAFIQWKEDHAKGGKVDQEKAKAEALEKELEELRQKQLAKLDAADAADSESESSKKAEREKQRQALMKSRRPMSRKNSTASQKTDDGIDPAVAAGEKAVKMLLNYQNKHGLTAMMVCVRHRCKESVFQLMKRGADPKLKVGEYDAEAIAIAAQYHDLVEILQMTDFRDWSGNMERRVARGQYFAAISEGHILGPTTEKSFKEKSQDKPSAVELISSGLVMPDQESDGGLTALIVASKNGNHQGVCALLQQGADPNYANRNGFTAVMAAAKEGHIPIVGELLKAGGDPNIEDLDGRSGITHSAGHTVVGRALIAAAKNGNEAGVAVIAEALRLQKELQDGAVHHDGAELLQWLGLHPPDPEFAMEFDSWKWRLSPELGGLGYAPNKPPTPEPPPTPDPHPPRCFKCTLTPPCKHYESIEELLEKEPEKARKWRWGERFKPDPPKQIGPLEPPSIDATHDLNWRMLHKAKIWRATDIVRLSRRLRMKRTNRIYDTIDAALLARKPPKGTLPSIRPKTARFKPSMAKTWSPAALKENMGSDGPAITALGRKIGKRPRSAGSDPAVHLNKLSPRPVSASTGIMLHQRAIELGTPVEEFDPRAELESIKSNPQHEGDLIEETRPSIPIIQQNGERSLTEVPDYIQRRHKKKQDDDKIQQILDYGKRDDEKIVQHTTNVQSSRSTQEPQADTDNPSPHGVSQIENSYNNESGDSSDPKKDNAAEVFEQRLKKLEYERMQDFYRSVKASKGKANFSEEKKIQQAMARETKAMSLEDERSTAIELRIRAEKKYLEERREARIRAEEEVLPEDSPHRVEIADECSNVDTKGILTQVQTDSASDNNYAAPQEPAPSKVRLKQPAKRLGSQSPIDKKDYPTNIQQLQYARLHEQHKAASDAHLVPSSKPSSGTQTPADSFAVAAQLAHEAETTFNQTGGWDESYYSENYYLSEKSALNADAADNQASGSNQNTEAYNEYVSEGQLVDYSNNEANYEYHYEGQHTDNPDEYYNSESQALVTADPAYQIEEYDYYAQYQEPSQYDENAENNWDEHGYYNDEYTGDQDNEAVLGHWYGEADENTQQSIKTTSTKPSYGNFVCGRCKKTFGRRLGTLKTARLCNECLANRKQAPVQKIGALHKKMRQKTKGFEEDDAIKRFNDLLDELDGKKTKGKRKKSMSKLTDKMSSNFSDMHTLLLAGRKKAETNVRDIQPDGFEIWRHRLDDYEKQKVLEDHMTNEQLAAREAERTGLEIYTKPAELDMAEWMIAQGQLKKVRPLIESALRAQREALGPDHVQVALTLRVRAKLLAAKGKLSAARTTLEESYEMLSHKLGPTHKECINSSHLIAEMYMKQGEYAHARLLYEMLSKEHQGSVRSEIQALCDHYTAKSLEVTEIEESTFMKREDDLAFAIEDRLRRPEVYEHALQGKQMDFLERLLQKRGPGSKISFKKFKKFAKEYGAEHLFGFYVNVHEFSLMKQKQEGFAKKARYIFKEFIKPQYKLPMLTKLIRAELTECMEEAIRPLTSDLFSAAQQLCLEAIFRGPYLQFMDTDDGKYFAERQQDR